MAAPTRFTSGISTYSPKSVFRDFPVVPSPSQAVATNEFLPYRSGDFTITQTNGTATSYPWNTGALKVSTAGSTTSDSINLQMTSQAFQFVPGNKQWFNITFAAGTAISDTNLYAGFADNVNFASAQNGVFFIKPAGGTAVHLNIVKNGTTTQFQNISDVQYPDGIYGNTTGASVGTLTTAGSGGAYTSVAVGTPGSGYMQAPLVLTTGATGSGAQVYCQLGSGSLYAPQLSAAGSSYTTYTNSVSHWISSSFYYNGNGTLYVAINGKQIISIGLGGSPGNTVNSGTVVTAGGTYNTATSGTNNYFVSGTQLTTSVMPIQPKAGDVINILPLNALYAEAQLTNTTANARTIYVNSFQLAGEYN